MSRVFPVNDKTAAKVAHQRKNFKCLTYNISHSDNKSLILKVQSFSTENPSGSKNT